MCNNIVCLTAKKIGFQVVPTNGLRQVIPCNKSPSKGQNGFWIFGMQFALYSLGVSIPMVEN